MSIINRYLIYEILKTFSGVFFILLLIVVSNRFVKYLSEAASGGISVDIIFILLALKSIKIMVYLIPVSFFFSILLAMGRFYRDNEMTVMFSCGIGERSIYHAVIELAIPLTLITAALTFYIVPWSYKQDSLVKVEGDQSTNISGIAPGRFNEFKKGGLIYYVEHFSKEKNQMQNVFIKHDRPGNKGLVTSASAYHYKDEQTGDRFFVLQDGVRYEQRVRNSNAKIISFEKYAVKIHEKSVGAVALSRKAMPIDQLLLSGVQEDRAELHWRLAIPLSLMVLAILAVPLSRSSPREGRYGKLTVAILIYILYINILTVSKSWLERGIYPEWIGLWWVHLLMLMLMIYWSLGNGGWRWLKIILSRKAMVQ